MSTDNTEQALPPLGEEIEHAIGATSPHLLALAKRYAANTVHSYLFAVEAEAIVRRAVRLLRECETTLAMWADVAPAVSLRSDIRRALGTADECMHKADPRGCYRVRCQLGRKCVDA